MFSFCKSDTASDPPRNMERKPLNQTQQQSYEMSTKEGNSHQLETLGKELEQEKEKTKTLQSRNDKLEKDITSLNSQLQSLGVKLDSSQLDLSQRAREKEELERELGNVRHELDQSKQRTKALETQIEVLTANIERERQEMKQKLSENTEKLAVEMDQRYTGLINDYKQKIEELQSAMDQLKASTSSYDVSQMERKVQELETQTKRYEETISDLNSSKETTVNSLHQQNETLKHELQEAVGHGQKLEKQVEDLLSQNAMYGKTLELSKEKSANEHNEELTQLRHTIENLKTENDTIQSQLKALSEVEKEALLLKQQRDEIETRLKTELLEMEKQYHAQIMELRRDKEEYVTTTASADLTVTTTELQTQIDNLKQEATNYQLTIEEIKQLLAATEKKLKDALSAAESEKIPLIQQNAALQEQLENVKKESEVTTTKLGQDLQSLTAQLEGLKDNCDALKKQVENLTSQNADYQTRIQELQESEKVASALREQIAELQNQKKEEIIMLEQAKAEMENKYIAELTELRREKEALATQTQANTTTAYDETVVNQLNQQIAQLGQQYEGAQQQNKQLQNQLEEETAGAKKLVSQIEELRSQLTTLEEQLRAAQTKTEPTNEYGAEAKLRLEERALQLEEKATQLEKRLKEEEESHHQAADLVTQEKSKTSALELEQDSLRNTLLTVTNELNSYKEKNAEQGKEILELKEHKEKADQYVASSGNAQQEKEELENKFVEKEQEIFALRQTNTKLESDLSKIQSEKQQSDLATAERIKNLEENVEKYVQTIRSQEQSLQSLEELKTQVAALESLRARVTALETEKKELESALSVAQSKEKEAIAQAQVEAQPQTEYQTQGQAPAAAVKEIPSAEQTYAASNLSVESEQKTSTETETSANPSGPRYSETPNVLPREASTADNEDPNAPDDDKVTNLNWTDCGSFIKTKINAQTADKIWEKLQDESGMIPASKLVELMIFVGTLQVSYEYKRKNLGKPQIHKAKLKKFITPFQLWLVQNRLAGTGALSKKQFIEELGDWVVEFSKIQT